MNELTDRQKEVLNYIAWFLDREGYAPTYRKIASHFGWSSFTASVGHCEALEKKGYLRKTPRGYIPETNPEGGDE